ncbi:MAG TPA: YhdP family protein, partial [Gammaproteobacteria bacterium]|nr:YhdP family protein [Gammaproteobacteria bacterium]
MLLQVLRSLYHTIWYIVAGLIVVTAVAVTLARLSLPYIDNFRPDIQHWLGDYLGHPVEIEKIEADWQGWKPSLYLQQITVLNKSGVGKITDFKSAVIRFDPFYSLLQRQPVPSKVQINSPELTVIRQLDGSITITREAENLPFDDQTTSQTEITRWLLLQREIAINDARLTLVNLARQDRTIELSNVSLSFRNITGRTQIAGSADLPGRYGDSIDFALDIHGDISTPDWSGELFLKASAVAPSAILDYAEIRPKNLAFSSSPVTMNLWSRWRNARVYRVDGTFAVDALQLVNPEGKTHNFSNFAARFAVRRNEQDDFALSLETGNYGANNDFTKNNSIHIYREQIPGAGDSRYSAGFSQLDLNDIVPWLNVIPGLNTDQLLPPGTKLGGMLTDARVIYNPILPDRKQLYIDSDFRDLSILYDDNGIRELQGHIRGDMGEGRLDLVATTLELDLPGHFHKPLNFYETEGTIDWHHVKGEWTISTDSLKTHTLHFHSDFNGKFTFSENGSNRFADLGVTIRNLNLEDIDNYLPSTLGSDLSEWLENALTAGEVSSLDILLRGQPDAFPFRGNDGRFQILATINNATLDYDPAWTPVDNLAAELQINQDLLTVNATSGNILSADITDATAIIANLGAGKPLLEVNGSVNGTLDDAMVFINNSPLADDPTFREISEHGLQGGLALSIEMAIPLYAESSRVNGDIELFNATLDSDTVGFRLDNINGNVVFTRDGFQSEKLSARYADQDVQLEVKSKDGDLPIMSLSGVADNNFLASQFESFYPELGSLGSEIRTRVSGTTGWVATLTTDRSATGSKNRKLTINSSLAGLKLDMPAPLGKTEKALPLALSTPLTATGRKTIDFNYGEILSGIFELDETGPGRLHRASLNFGAQAELRDKPGIVINGSIEQLSLSEWFNFINTPGVTLDSSLLDEMDFNVVAQSLIFFDQAFADVNFNLFRQQSDWKIKLLGNQINGNITVPESGTGKPLHASFSKLHITDREKNGQKTLIRPDEIPPLRITVDNFHYEDINLGELTLNSSKTPTGMSVDEMTFVKPDMTITGNGKWQYINDIERCEFTFDLHAEYLDAMLQTFNYSVAPIKDGATTLTLDAKWNGSPGDFSLANMDGTLLMDIEKGQFLDIEPAAGRLFGLLSLQTLPRRLSLDFSDLFSEGLTFDRIEGDFTIQSGNAYTNNLTLTGPSANIDVTGRTGLVDQDYDQLVTVTPQFADSLPVASALFGPIG